MPGRRLTRRDRLVLVCAALAAVLLAVPGVHVLELWLRPGAAVAASHALALGELALTARELRGRRARAARTVVPAG